MKQNDLSDYLLAEIAVVHQNGAIARTNRKWKQTATIGKLSQKQPNWNYITECETAIRRNCVDAATILDGLREVLERTLALVPIQLRLVRSTGYITGTKC